MQIFLRLSEHARREYVQAKWGQVASFAQWRDFANFCCRRNSPQIRPSLQARLNKLV